MKLAREVPALGLLDLQQPGGERSQVGGVFRHFPFGLLAGGDLHDGGRDACHGVVVGQGGDEVFSATVVGDVEAALPPEQAATSGASGAERRRCRWFLEGPAREIVFGGGGEVETLQGLDKMGSACVKAAPRGPAPGFSEGGPFSEFATLQKGPSR